MKTINVADIKLKEIIEPVLLMRNFVGDLKVAGKIVGEVSNCLDGSIYISVGEKKFILNTNDVVEKVKSLLPADTFPDDDNDGEDVQKEVNAANEEEG